MKRQKIEINLSVEALVAPIASAQMARQHRGLFVLFEGVDRCGKSTQARLLAEHWARSGQPVVSTRFPDRSTTIGGVINSYLRRELELDDHAVHLLFSANRWERKCVRH